MAVSSSDLPHNLIGFVGDPVSEQIINNVIKNSGMTYSEVRQGTLADIIEFLKNNRTPKVLIVDISDYELPLGDITKIREHCTPNVNIIAIGSKNDVGLFRDLMAMGVSDYLVKPLNDSLLRHAVEVARGSFNEYVEKTGKMIYFVSSVGGAGTTTATANVGWILANRHFKRTLVMDMDFLFGTTNLMLDIKAENAYLDILESPDKIDDYFTETIIKKCDQRLHYLGGLVDLLKGVNTDLDAFETLVNLVKKQFNYLLVDSQRDFDGINKVCMKKADSFVIMSEMSVASAHNTMRILEFLHTDQPEKKVVIAANKVGLSSRGALTKESFERVIGKKINYTMPLDEGVTLAAANIGQPLVVSASPLTDVLEDLTNDILGKKESQDIARAIIKSKGSTIARIKDLTLGTLDKVLTKLK
ncbi:MAG: AAA family ATPase [Holosporaceae bacterium]|jgi:pilus assembly protein CpaE|nr:AAA family ATPase [Holosporaceae bacterium]